MRVLLMEAGELDTDVSVSLRREGYLVDCVQGMDAARRAFGCAHYDLFIVDVCHDRREGIVALTQYRRLGGEAPVILVTEAEAIEDALVGLDAGANDYLCKPLVMGQLSMRIQTWLRRHRIGRTPVYTHGLLELDPAARSASKNGVGIHLSPREFTLLQALLEEPNRVFSRTELEQRLYRRGEAIRSKAVEVHVHYLRQKLGNDEIITIRGNGYRLKMLA
jgi:two-component system response regulator QseB